MRALTISFSGKVKSKLVNNHAMEVSGYRRLSAAIQKYDWLLDTLPKGVRERHRGYWDFVYIKVNTDAKATHERLSKVPGWKPTIAMDPGVIDMIVAYDSVGHSYRFAAGGYGKLSFLNKKQDNLKSQLQNQINALLKEEPALAAKKRKLLVQSRPALKLLQAKITKTWKALDSYTSRVRETITDFITDYDCIACPKLQVTQMVKKGKARGLGKTNKRQMLHWGHGYFRVKLQLKCRKKSHELVWCSEAWSTKSCSSCGTICSPGRSRVFTCHNPSCHSKMSRDGNAARSIL